MLKVDKIIHGWSKICNLFLITSMDNLDCIYKVKYGKLGNNNYLLEKPIFGQLIAERSNGIGNGRWLLYNEYGECP